MEYYGIITRLFQEVPTCFKFSFKGVAKFSEAKHDGEYLLSPTLLRGCLIEPGAYASDFNQTHDFMFRIYVITDLYNCNGDLSYQSSFNNLHLCSFALVYSVTTAYSLESLQIVHVIL